jgi:hypothetical protein
MLIGRIFISGLLAAACSVLALGGSQKVNGGKGAMMAKVAKPTYSTVMPILKANCVKCHAGAQAAHGLALTTYASTMKGDKEGKVIIAGNPSKSRLARVLHGKPKLMPPDHALRAGDIAKIEAWIKAGAKEK